MVQNRLEGFLDFLVKILSPATKDLTKNTSPESVEPFQVTNMHTDIVLLQFRDYFFLSMPNALGQKC